MIFCPSRTASKLPGRRDCSPRSSMPSPRGPTLAVSLRLRRARSSESRLITWCCSMNKSSRVVLVTGTSSGFGRAIAAALARDGHRVFASTRGSDAAVPGAPHVTLDVTDAASVADCVAAVMNAGRIDVLINNAGLGIAGAIEDTSDDEAHAQFDANFFGMHRMCRAVLPHMRQQGGGFIINMSSLAGQIAIPFQGFYSASKFAIEGYTEALRMEVRSFGVRVSMIEPGDFATAFTMNRRMTGGHAPESPYYRLCESAVERM